MITIRFPSGFSVQYNDLGYVKGGTDCTYLYTDEAAPRWSVRVPRECIIELVAPCRTYNPAASDPAEIEQIVASTALLAKEVRSMKRELAKWKAARS